jgi:hypothetical protein
MNLWPLAQARPQGCVGTAVAIRDPQVAWQHHHELLSGSPSPFTREVASQMAHSASLLVRTVQDQPAETVCWFAMRSSWKRTAALAALLLVLGEFMTP